MSEDSIRKLFDKIDDFGIRLARIETILDERDKAKKSYTAEQQGYIFYNYGTLSKLGYLSDITDGEYFFNTSNPTESQLKSAFPSTASSKEFTLVTNGVTGDTLKFYDTTITLGTDVAVGATIAETIANLVTYMKSNVLLTGNYKITSTDNSFVLTERFCGGGIVIPDITTTGTIKLSSKTLSDSVWGYETQSKHERKLALQAKADALKNTYRNAYFSALADGDSATAELNLGYAKELKTSLYNAMEAINDE